MLNDPSDWLAAIGMTTLVGGVFILLVAAVCAVWGH